MASEVKTQAVAEAWGVTPARVHQRMRACGVEGRLEGRARLWPAGAVEVCKPGPHGARQGENRPRFRPRKSR